MRAAQRDLARQPGQLARGKTLVFENLPPNLLALAALYGVADLVQPDPS